MTKINAMLLKLESFWYPMSNELNMKYYYIRLTKDSSDLCMDILPSGKHRYKLLALGVSNSPYIFQ